MRARLAAEAAEAAVKHGPRLKKELDDSIKNYSKRLPVLALPVASETEVSYHDMTRTVGRDIWAPVKQADGTYKQTIIVPKGTKVNALKRLQPKTAMLFIDGRDKEQVELMDEVMKKDRAGIQPILVAGDPTALAKIKGYPVYYANTEMLTGFNVKHAPAFLKAAGTVRPGSVEITALARPFDQKEIWKRWVPVLSPGTAGSLTACLTPEKCGSSSKKSP